MWNEINYIFDSRQKRHLIILFVIIFIGGLMELLGVSLVYPVVDLILEPNIMYENKWFVLICDIMEITDQMTFVMFLLVTLIIIYFLKNAYLIMMYNFQYRFTYNNQRRLAFRLMSCYMHQDFLFHLSKNTSELQWNVTTDISQFFTLVLNVIQLLSELVTCVFLTIFLLNIDFVTTVGVIIFIGLFIFLFYNWFRGALGRLGEKYRYENAQLIKWIQQSFGGIKEIKVMNREEFFLHSYDECYKKVANMQRKQSLMQIIPKPTLETIGISGLLSVILVRIYMGEDLLRFVPRLSVFALSAFRLMPSFNRITTYLGTIMFTKASVHAVYQELKEVEQLLKIKGSENNDDVDLKMQEGILIKDISFKYPNTDKYILNHATLTIPAQSSVAFIGVSGAGKTTLADVILGMLEPESGEIAADGVNVYKHLYSWHKLLGYIPQMIYLMDDTIRNNVTFGIQEDKINEEQVWRALRQAQLEEFVKSLDEGLDTVVGERGMRLSGGQRQRIGIARALYSNPPILVLDEATSALDSDTENAVMEAIENLQGEKTMIIIAHRLTTIRNCDLIYEVYDGQIRNRRKEEVLYKS